MKRTVLTLTLLLTVLAQLTAPLVQAEVSIPDDNLAAVIREALELPPGAAITSDALRSLTRLNARGRGIADLTGMEYAVNLTGLFLGQIYVDNEWHQNPISDVSPLSALTQLTSLDLWKTAVSDIAVLAHLKNLKYLHLGGTGVWDVSPLAHLTQLETLNLGGTGVWDVSPLAHLTQLETLNLGGTGVWDVSPLAHLTNLKELGLLRTGVWDVSPLAHLTQLETLNLGDTAVSDIAVLAHLTQLETLVLHTTAVSDVSALASLTNLETLNLGGTAVSDIAVLAHLKNLKHLYLGGTDVLDIAVLAHLTNLKELGLGGTGVSDVSALAGLTQLIWLALEDCPLNADAHQTHIPAIQANGTEVSFSPFKPIPFKPIQLPDVPGLVYLFYIRDSDRPVRPNVDAKIDALIKKAQRFFADEMERHGFGRKTFQFEADANGNAVVHHNKSLIDIPRQSISVNMLDGISLGTSVCGIGGGSPFEGGLATMYCWSWDVIAHELGHAFGMGHDFRSDSYIMSHGEFRRLELSSCAAAWLDVHPAFNPTVVRRRTRATIRMLPTTLAAPPNAIRLRFEVTAPAGSLYQARLWIGSLIGCKRIDGNPTSRTVEFVTTALTPDTESVSLKIIGIDGDIAAEYKQFPIDVAYLLPPAKVVTIPDPNLAAAVRERLNIPSGEPLTTHSTPSLVKLLVARKDGIKDLTGLEHAVNLTVLQVRDNPISNLSPLASLTNLKSLDLARTGVSDVSALAHLKNLDTLYLGDNQVSDISALASLTNLKSLDLAWTGVSDVSALAHLKNLKRLSLKSTDVSDISPLSALTQLRWLDIQYTYDVLDISPLSALTQLEELSLATAASDISPLSALTWLEELDLDGAFDVSDISPLSALTQLNRLSLRRTAVSDISPLSALPQLEVLDFRRTEVSDVSPLLGLSPLRWVRLQDSPLSYASIHTHIPAMQVKGIEVEFDNVAHPALLKTSGDSQEGAPGATLKTPFVVEAMDEHGKPIVGKTVQFSVLEGEGTLSAKTVETDARGKARVTLTLGWYPGVNKVKATSEGIRSYVLFTAVGTEEAPQPVADVNGDGSVNIQDLVLVAGQFGETGKNSADVNGDGVVNIQDLVLVAGAFGEGAAAPSARAVSLSRLTASDVEGWLNEARVSIRSGSGDPELQHRSASRPGGLTYLRGIAVLERLLATLMPKETVLLANYPNPFNPETWIPYQLSKPAEVTVTIYAANGAVVRTLDFGHRRAGSYDSRGRAAYWDGRNAQGEPVASGVYFYTLSAGEFSATRKMVIRK